MKDGSGNINARTGVTYDSAGMTFVTEVFQHNLKPGAHLVSAVWLTMPAKTLSLAEIAVRITVRRSFSFY
jgi:alkylhydroperoxidase/carboxymuconolactone decarboxylase family protein YurZ